MIAAEPTRARLPAVDWIKALAIVAVVCTHAGPPFWSPRFTTWDFALRQAWPSFHVPAFLFIAGFLYARPTPLSLPDVGGRLARVLVSYVIASAVVYTLGIEDAPNVPFLLALATGSALGVYYFVLVLTVCIVLSWPISRLDVTGLTVLTIALVGFLVVQLLVPALQLPLTPLWMMRDPLSRFYIGYFILGWVFARVEWPAALSPSQRRQLGCMVFAVGSATWIWGFLRYPTIAATSVFWYSPRVLTRIAYTLGVMALIAAFTADSPAPRWVRFLSDTTFVLYLYHFCFQTALAPRIAEWRPLARMAASLAIGLSGALTLALLGRAVLGRERARILLGA